MKGPRNIFIERDDYGRLAANDAGEDVFQRYNAGERAARIAREYDVAVPTILRFMDACWGVGGSYARHAGGRPATGQVPAAARMRAYRARLALALEARV